MEKKEHIHNIASVAGDFLLSIVAVGILGITFVSVSGLTPKANPQMASNPNQAVLGTTTKTNRLSYFPAQTRDLPFIQSYNLTESTSDGEKTIKIGFGSLEASSYTFTVVTIKNTSADFAKVQLTPSYSLDGSYTTISVTYAGQKNEIISATGLVTPLDLVIPPNSTSDVAITLEPTTKLVTPVSLTLGFTEAQ